MSEIILFFNRSLTPLSFNSKNNFSFQKIRKIFIRFTTSNLLTIHIMPCNCLHTKKTHKLLSNLHCIFSRPLKRCFYLNCVWAFEDHQKPLGLFVIVAEIKQFTKTEEKIHFWKDKNVWYYIKILFFGKQFFFEFSVPFLHIRME